MHFIIFALVAVLLSSPLSSFADDPAAGAQAPKVYQLNKNEQEQFKGLSPTEKAEVMKQAQKKLQDMSAADKKDLEGQARAKIDAMSPADQQELKEDALHQWQSMSPEEQQELKNQFPDLLKGDLILDNGS